MNINVEQDTGAAEICGLWFNSIDSFIEHFKTHHQFKSHISNENLIENQVSSGQEKCINEWQNNNNEIAALNDDLLKNNIYENIYGEKVDLIDLDKKDNKQYLCTVCGKTYTELTKLTIHEQDHFIEAQCKICGKINKTGKNLDRYKKCHDLLPI